MTGSNPFDAPRTTPGRGRRGGRTGNARQQRQRRVARRAHGYMIVGACLFSLSALVLTASGVYGLVQGEHPGIALVLLAIGLAFAIGPIGVFMKRSWALPPMYIMAVLSLLNLPIGTVVGIMVLANGGKAKAIYT